MTQQLSRRGLLVGAAVGGATWAATGSAFARGGDHGASAPRATLPHAATSSSLFNRWPGQDYRSFSFLRHLNQIGSGGASFAEMIGIANRIGDPVTSAAWIREFTAAGVEAGRKAAKAKRTAPQVSADASLRQSTYLRAAEFFIDPLSHRPEKIALYKRSRSAFQRWAAAQETSITTVNVPFEKHGLEGVLVAGHGTSRRRPGPAVIVFGGADSICEELVTGYGLLTLARSGVTVLALDGPGCGATVRLHGTTTRPDYEVAAAAAVDYLERRRNVDPHRIGLIGLSLGGYYAIRSAAFEPRLRCCVAWTGIWNFLDAVGTTPDPDPDPDFTAFKISQGQWIFGGANLSETLQRLAKFKLDGVAQRVKVPTLILHGASDTIVPVAQARSLSKALKCPHRTVIFPAGKPGETHCQNDDPTTAIAEIAPFLARHLKASK
jgi:dienelactone hydrolase